MDEFVLGQSLKRNLSFSTLGMYSALHLVSKLLIDPVLFITKFSYPRVKLHWYCSCESYAANNAAPNVKEEDVHVESLSSRTNLNETFCASVCISRISATSLLPCANELTGRAGGRFRKYIRPVGPPSNLTNTPYS